MKFCVLLVFAMVVVSAVTGGHHHKHLNDEEYRDYLQYVAKLRQARKEAQLKQLQKYGSSSSESHEGNRQQRQDATIAPILTGPSSSGSSSSGVEGDRLPELPIFNPTPRPPADPETIRRVNDGLSTILGGVKNLNLEQILRGSFKFTRNGNVRSVADTVLDSVFGNGVPKQRSA